MFQKAGVDLTRETGWLPNLAAGKPVTASFTTTTPACGPPRRRTPSTASPSAGCPIQQGTYLARNPIWGTQGSPNAQDWLEVDLGAPTRFNTVKLYFFSDKNYGSQGGQHLPAAGLVRGAVPRRDGLGRRAAQARTPSAPPPNYNLVDFAPVTAQRVRVLVRPTTGFGIGLKEIQVFDAIPRSTMTRRDHGGAQPGAPQADRWYRCPVTVTLTGPTGTAPSPAWPAPSTRSTAARGARSPARSRSPATGCTRCSGDAATPLTFIPYHAWGNRGRRRCGSGFPRPRTPCRAVPRRGRRGPGSCRRASGPRSSPASTACRRRRSPSRSSRPAPLCCRPTGS